jgi:hypothetical protein
MLSLEALLYEGILRGGLSYDFAYTSVMIGGGGVGRGAGSRSFYSFYKFQLLKKKKGNKRTILLRK